METIKYLQKILEENGLENKVNLIPKPGDFLSDDFNDDSFEEIHFSNPGLNLLKRFGGKEANIEELKARINFSKLFKSSKCGIFFTSHIKDTHKLLYTRALLPITLTGKLKVNPPIKENNSGITGREAISPKDGSSYRNSDTGDVYHGSNHFFTDKCEQKEALDHYRESAFGKLIQDGLNFKEEECR